VIEGALPGCGLSSRAAIAPKRWARRTQRRTVWRITPICSPTAVEEGFARYARSMRARSTRIAGSVRDRAIDSSRLRSSEPIDNSITRRGAAMTPCHRTYTPNDYKAVRERGKPSQWASFMESMY